jgi:hypothetical protein
MRVALNLQKQPDAKAVVVGEATAKEKAKTAKEEEAARKHKHVKAADLAAERAVNTKDYLVTEKGIDASRISVATGTADGRRWKTTWCPRAPVTSRSCNMWPRSSGG